MFGKGIVKEMKFTGNIKETPITLFQILGLSNHPCIRSSSLFNALCFNFSIELM